MRLALFTLLCFVYLASCEPVYSTKLSANVLNCLEEQVCPKKFWIFFEDKGLHLHSPDELSQLQQSIIQSIHPNSAYRRTKHKPNNHLELDIKDYPVFASYIDSVKRLPGVNHSKTSKWQNSISIHVTEPQILIEIAKFNFVHKIDIVRQFRKTQAVPTTHEKLEKKSIKNGKEMYYEGDLHYGDSYNQLNAIEVPQLHLLGLTGNGVNVLILDSGFNLDHPALKNLNIVRQHDFVNDDDDVTDQSSDEIEDTDPEQHGTATLSTLGGKDDGELYGPAFGANFLLAKTESVLIEDPVEEDYFISAVEWGEEFGTDVISASLGYQDWYSYNDKDGTSLIDQTIDTAVDDRGIVAVVAVGNEHKYNLGPGVPGDCLRALSIGATYLNGDIAYFSSQGPTIDGRYKPDLCAPGFSIYVANWNFGTGEPYISMSGTSFSTPLVAGVVALLLESHPTWRPNDIQCALRSTASQANSPDNIYGWGSINATAANNYVIPTQPSHEHGNCDDFERCQCNEGYYGPYCAIALQECESYCNGGYCDDTDCHCDTRWEGKLCIGKCEAEEGGCIACLQSGCGFCSETQSCVSKGFAAQCSGDYSETHCDSLVQANADNSINVDAYFVLAVLIVCFSVLLVASAFAFFFCIIRP